MPTAYPLAFEEPSRHLVRSPSAPTRNSAGPTRWVVGAIHAVNVKLPVRRSAGASGTTT